MKTSLPEFIEEINQSRKSGLLSIPVTGANTLLKLFFREGEVYYLTCGNVKGVECLGQITGHECTQYFFMPNVSLNVHDESIPPLSDLIQLFKNAGTVVEAPSHPGTGVSQPTPTKPGSATTTQENLKLALTRQIGPAGSKVMTRIVEQQWRPSSPPSKEDYLRLIELLKNEIENPDDRNTFYQEARAVLP